MDVLVYMERFLGSPALLTALLFLVPFVFDEAAILAGSALAAAGELSAATAFLALFLGIVASDWMLYGLGAAAARNRRVRGWIGEANVARGRRLLGRGVLVSAVLARLVPWLLLPIFVASGYVGVGFLRFAAVNLPVALVSTAVLFLALYLFNVALFDVFARWGWIVVLVGVAGMIIAMQVVRRRYGAPAEAEDPADPEG